MNEKNTGNARAISYSYPPIVRMTNTIIENSNNNIKDILKIRKMDSMLRIGMVE